MELEKKFWIETQYPIAFTSPDHLKPWGTSRDNHSNTDLVQELEEYFGKKIKVLDLGCSGGAYIKGLTERGNYALGLEGSDYSIIHQRAEWPQLHFKNLFTCDISKPYKIFLYDSHSIEQVKFDVINAWEVIEHIHPDDLEIFFTNIKNHLSDDGIFIGSISCVEEIIEDVKLHQSVFSEDNWKIILAKYFEISNYPFKNKLRDDVSSSMFVLLKNKKVLK